MEAVLILLGLIGLWGNNLMFRALFIATNSDLTEVKGDLAEDYNVSEDGLTYTITLKDGLSWSDGEA